MEDTVFNLCKLLFFFKLQIQIRNLREKFQYRGMILRFGLTKKSMNVTVNNQSIIRKHFCNVKTIPNGFILEKKKGLSLLTTLNYS